LFFKRDKSNYIIFLVYIDEMLVATFTLIL